MVTWSQEMKATPQAVETNKSKQAIGLMPYSDVDQPLARAGPSMTNTFSPEKREAQPFNVLLYLVHLGVVFFNRPHRSLIVLFKTAVPDHWQAVPSMTWVQCQLS